ncbi:MAG: N-acetyltransferase [Allomuricauda sp.]|nr:MAG: N-acetyltransferase [Allomuricauda sp.]
MEISVRKAEKRDVTAILAIVNYEILNSTLLYDYEERTFQQQLTWFEQKEREKMPVIVAELETQVIGFGTYGIFRPWDAYQFSVEHSIYVTKEFRGKGVGKRLLTQLIELAKTNGYHTMIAGVDGSNKKSFEFHKNFGFEEIGTFKEIGFKFNKWLDLRFLQLFLKEN